jgi:hypothetical protein
LQVPEESSQRCEVFFPSFDIRVEMMDLTPSSTDLMNMHPSKTFAIYSAMIRQECPLSPFPFLLRQECPLSPFPFLLIVNNAQDYLQESNMSLTRLSVTDSETKQEAIN